MARTTSIRQSLLANLTALIALMGAVMIGGTVYATRLLTETLTREIIDRDLAATELELRRYFDPATAALRTAAEWGDAGMLDPARPRRLVRLLRPLLEVSPQLAALRISHDDGREFVLLREADAWRTRETRRDEWGSRARWFTWRDDASPARGEWRERGDEPRLASEFRGAGRARIPLNPAPNDPGERRLSWTDAGVLPASERHGITVSTTFDAEGARRGVVAIDVLLGAASPLDVAPRGEAGAAVAVLTRDLRIVAMAGAAALAAPGERARARLARADELGWRLGADALSALRAQPPGRALRFDNAGESYWAERRRFTLGAGQGLWILALVSERAVLGTLHALRVWGSGLLVAVLVVALARAIVLSRRYSRPMEALVEETDRMSLGNLAEGAPIDSRVTEIRRLAEAHARMRAGLRSLVRMEDDLRVARRIQQNALPSRIPYVPGFDIDAFSEPAEQTGGDTYDVVGYRADAAGRAVALSLENANRALLLLADATGHGIGPALSATQLRAMLRMAVRTGAGLDDIVHDVNEQLCEDLFGGRFITAWLGIVNADDGTLTSLSAGQAPMFHHHADGGRTETLGADTPPLGIARDLAFPAPSVRRMAPGDVFAVLSDGILESTNAAGEPFGEARAVELIARHRDETAGLIVTRLRQGVARHTTGSRASDDRTAVIVKRDRP